MNTKTYLFYISFIIKTFKSIQRLLQYKVLKKYTAGEVSKTKNRKLELHNFMLKHVKNALIEIALYTRFLQENAFYTQ